ncbi:hypothetical protein KUV51_16110 [Tateyamaria omphalii]|uniref:hypothetical protein n=1 Tax=Tateyamaria omphalii TaxID=299262 RepID=UPI001C99A659|nr:hypothetical protein [Tateyamaria omphalii]MBY5934534.1 hypothetical protein [Tateyamaria omphalii]
MELSAFEDISDSFVFAGPADVGSVRENGFGSPSFLDPAQLPNDGFPPAFDLNAPILTDAEADFMLRLGERILEDPNLQDDIDRLSEQDEITYLDRLEITADFLESVNQGYYDDIFLEAANWPEPDPAPPAPPIVEVLPVGDDWWWAPEQSTWESGGAWGGVGGGNVQWDAFYAEHEAIF